MKFNDFFVGQTFKTKFLEMSKEDIMRFASEFDPQYMHLDEDKAKKGRFNGIIASGVHTLAVTFKLWIETGSYGDDVIAGTAFNNIKFIKPVYPGDILNAHVEVIEVKEKNDTGLVTVRFSTFNNNEELVFTGDLSALVQK
ncbi:MaoC family dehydratase [Paenibacillus sp. NPDC056933]|uniref:MaoC family dehydratase n=1 Tax=Paenibacillus sp. NPDC056933 TaxID=3345968 RepID=UPI003644D454